MGVLGQLKEILDRIDWAAFHFLRPRALHLFWLLLGVTVILLLGNRDKNKWKSTIAPALRPYMFTGSSKLAIILPLLAFLAAASCVIIGMSGPTWRKKQVPGEKVQAVVLLAVDVSASMLARDIQPNRLERAKFKLADFLAANPRTRTGLVAFAGTAHLVMPFTSDYKLITFQSKALKNAIMPAQGTNFPVLVSVIDSLMKPIEAVSTVLLVTDGLDGADATALAAWTRSTKHRLEILLLSTSEGGRLPGHPNVMLRQDPAVIANLAQDTSVVITPITLDKSDVEGIAERVRKKLVFQKMEKSSEKEWDDMGWLLIVPAALLVLFCFRRGWSLYWCVPPFLIFALASCGVKSRHPDWWYSKDYQGQLWENEGDYPKAAELFDDTRHRAVAYFKSGNFESAAALFALDSTSAGHYNRGLALAGLGRYDEAMNALNTAARLDPALRAATASSIAAIRNAEQQARKAMQYDPALARKEGRKPNERHGDSLKLRRPQGGDESLSADKQVKQLPKSGERISDKVASSVHRFRESDKPDPNFKADPAGQSAGDILLRRAQADPSAFLHKRFQLQIRRNYPRIPKSKTQW